MILAIDPGNIESAYAYISENNLMPKSFGKCNNEQLLAMLNKLYEPEHIAIEMIASYGMPVGKEVFETCVWIGRFQEALIKNNAQNIQFVTRKEVKMNLCGSMKAKDSNIRQALIDRFGVVGTKKAPGWFYGFKADIWSAYAVGVTYYDTTLKARG
jgi:hypothetical protein